MKPGNLHNLFHVMRWCQPDAGESPLNDKSERLRNYKSFPHVEAWVEDFFVCKNNYRSSDIYFLPYYK